MRLALSRLVPAKSFGAHSAPLGMLNIFPQFQSGSPMVFATDGRLSGADLLTRLISASTASASRKSAITYPRAGERSAAASRLAAARLKSANHLRALHARLEEIDEDGLPIRTDEIEHLFLATWPSC
jgi:hypothetical protein